MTRLQSRSLSVLPIPSVEVETLYRLWGNDPNPGSRTFRRVCESHERLRAELQGTEEELKEGDDREKAHAAEIARLRAGLVFVFARAPDWSAADVRASVADLLGMKVQDVQAEIDATN